MYYWFITIVYVIKCIILLPIDIIIMLFGGTPLSYYVWLDYRCDCIDDCFNKNELECIKKYNMTMLEKIRLEKKKVLGENFAEIEKSCAMTFEPWSGLEAFHDMMCCTEGLFDELLEEHINFLKFEREKT